MAETEHTMVGSQTHGKDTPCAGCELDTSIVQRDVFGVPQKWESLRISNEVPERCETWAG